MVLVPWFRNLINALRMVSDLRVSESRAILSSLPATHKRQQKVWMTGLHRVAAKGARANKVVRTWVRPAHAPHLFLLFIPSLTCWADKLKGIGRE